MSNLTKVETNTGVEIYIDNSTGESFTSISGYARMANLSKQAISARCDRQRTVNGLSLKTAEILTAQGLRTVNLIPEKTIAQWLSKDNPTLAQDLMLLGVRKFLHTMAGYKPESDTPVVKLPTPKELALLLLAAEEDKERLTLELDHAVETITQLEPKAELADKFIVDDGLTTIGDFAKDYAKKGLGRNNLFALLRAKGWLLRDNHPAQLMVNMGYMVEKPTTTHVEYGEVVQDYRTFLTPKGCQWLLKKLNDPTFTSSL